MEPTRLILLGLSEPTVTMVIRHPAPDKILGDSVQGPPEIPALIFRSPDLQQCLDVHRCRIEARVAKETCPPGKRDPFPAAERALLELFDQGPEARELLHKPEASIHHGLGLQPGMPEPDHVFLKPSPWTRR